MSPTEPLFTTRAFTPTPEQLAIQTAGARSLLIEANAGAAKTTTLALRMAESWQRGTAPDAFLALVHTDTACLALHAALKKIGVPAPVRQRMRIATFEQFCTQLLADPGARAVPVPVLATPEQLRPHVWQAVQQVESSNALDGRWQGALQLPSQGDSGFVEEFLAVAARLKGTLADERLREDGDGPRATPAYAEALGVDFTLLCVFLASERLRRGGLADEALFRGPHDATYDLARALHCASAVPADFPRWPLQVRSVCVDEMHDMNQATFTVLAALLNSTFSLFCGVGDRDQVLFGRSGADARFMQDAVQQATGRAVLRLPLTPSHRFGRRLAAKVARLAAKPYASAAAHDTGVSLQVYESGAECVQLVLAELAHWRAVPRARMDQFAVLLRHPHLSVGLENAFIAAGIPYTLSGFDSYLLRPEVLLVRGLLAVASDNFDSVAEPRTRTALVQALVFFCGARLVVAGREDEAQEVLLADAIRSVSDNPLFLQHFFQNQILPNVDAATRRRLRAGVAAARQPAAPGMLQSVLDALDISAFIHGALVSRQRRQEALGNIAGLCEAARGFASAHAYFLHLNGAEQRQAALRGPDSLVLAHIAEVKGLEFEHVVVPYLEQGVFPAPQTLPGEEQNTLYVAMTRARRQLTLLAHRDRPGRFVRQLGYVVSPGPGPVQQTVASVPQAAPAQAPAAGAGAQGAAPRSVATGPV